MSSVSKIKVDSFIKTLASILEDKNNVKIDVEVKEKAPEEVPVPTSVNKKLFQEVL